MAIYLILLIGTLNFAAFTGSRVAVSLYALELGADQLIIGILMTLYALCPMLFAVYIGKEADRVGPRRPMLTGTFGLALAMLLPTLFPGLTTLYPVSLLIGLSFHFFFVTISGITGGIGGTENRVRNYAMTSLGFSVAAFVGPIAAGFSIDLFGHLPTFLILGSFTLVPMLLLWLKPGFLPLAVKNEGPYHKRNTLDLWRHSTLRNTFIASGIIASAMDLFQFYMPVYGHAIGLPASVIGMIIGTCSLAAFIIRVILPHLVKSLGEIGILTYAIFVAAIAFSLFPFFKTACPLAAISFLLGLGLGCGMPMSMSLVYLLSPPGRVAEATGLRVTVNNFTHVIIPLIFGSMGSVFGFYPVFLSNAAILVAGGFIMRRNRPPEPGA
jgi:predicted MFS family arabinose efflux permease